MRHEENKALDEQKCRGLEQSKSNKRIYLHMQLFKEKEIQYLLPVAASLTSLDIRLYSIFVFEASLKWQWVGEGVQRFQI